MRIFEARKEHRHGGHGRPLRVPSDADRPCRANSRHGLASLGGGAPDDERTRCRVSASPAVKGTSTTLSRRDSCRQPFGAVAR